MHLRFGMLELLDQAMRELPEFLRSQEGWNSAHVTYHPPRVERIWRQWGNHRILLHRIHPCEDGEALFHPHPWPSAVGILSGHYEHRTGFQAHTTGDEKLPVTLELTRGVLTAGSSYEMTNPDAWHSVRPLEKPSDSVMVTGPLYEPPVKMPNPPNEKQGPLDGFRFRRLFEEWQERFFDMEDQWDPPVECGACGWHGRQGELFSYDKGALTHRCPKCSETEHFFPKGRRE